MKHVIWLTLAMFVCAGLLLPATAKPVQKEKEKDKAGGKDKIYDVSGTGLKIEGTLTDKDEVDPARNEFKAFHKLYLVKMKKGTKYTIRMDMVNKGEIDPFLRLEDSAGKKLAENDDAPGEATLNSRIDFDCEKDDTYKIVATNLAGPRTGAFVVTVKKAE